MSAQKHEFNMVMTCDGCSGAAKKVLTKLPEISESDIQFDMEKQKVYVTSTLPSEKLLETLQKTGKETSYVGVV